MAGGGRQADKINGSLNRSGFENSAESLLKNANSDCASLGGFAILCMLLWYHAAMSRITPGPNEN